MADHTALMEETLVALLKDKKYFSLRDILSTMNPADIAAIFDGLEEARLPLLFRLLPKELAADAFVEMEPEAQELLIQGFSDSELREVLDELYVDDAVDIVEEMPANVVRRILAQADPDMRKQINEILRYPEDSAGWGEFWFRGRSAFRLRDDLGFLLGAGVYHRNIAMCVRAGRHGRLTPLVVDLPHGGSGETLELVVMLSGTPVESLSPRLTEFVM